VQLLLQETQALVHRQFNSFFTEIRFCTLVQTYQLRYVGNAYNLPYKISSQLLFHRHNVHFVLGELLYQVCDKVC